MVRRASFTTNDEQRTTCVVYDQRRTTNESRVPALLSFRARDGRRHEMIDVERLADDVPHVRGVDAVDLPLRGAGHDDDAPEQRRAVALDPLEQLEAVDARHHQI